eukprot:snap_masked-scaffold_8-processed-gene-8.43-mRNA-1 protein AED:1.00 eAED:1.00 QI:0/0/0/0/1/1/2/0/96
MSRWGYQFQQVDMVVRHIPGENVAADILSRWGNRYAEEIVKEKNSEMDMLLYGRAEDGDKSGQSRKHQRCIQQEQNLLLIPPGINITSKNRRTMNF